MKSKKDLLVPAKPPAEFTRALAAEIVKNLTSIGRFTARPFIRHKDTDAHATKEEVLGEYPIMVDTSVFIDGRILQIVNSGFITGTLVIPQFILGELQHIADSDDSLRRAKGRRGLDIVNKLKGQKVNKLLHVKFVSSDPAEVKEVDAKLVTLAKRWANQKIRLLTVDFNLAHVARAQGVKILNVNDIAQALKVSLMPGEEFTVRITHEGHERAQGVGYLPDGTMVVVDNARDRVGQDVLVIITKVHQTPAGQLFFARLK
ncbi:MAG: TRAM domain-containing protein [Candidatus Gottesmanbacteria bacterium]|nr:TRAM domain-containing protein [Candidatus Gottesmanbacteria bacterium]